MTGAEALTALAPIIGTGGVASILIAWFGFRQEALKGRRDPPPITVLREPQIGPKDVELMANAVSLLTSALNALAVLIREEAEKRDVDGRIQDARLLQQVLDEVRLGRPKR